MYLSNMGYITYCNTDVNANFAIEDSPNTNEPRINSAVFVTNGHSGPGAYEFYGNSSKTYLTAKKQSGTTYYKFEDIDMSDCKAALFFGCKTNSDARESTYGVLTDQAHENGATCSFGWNKSVPTSSATTFRERMFYFLRKGYSVDESAKKTKSEMPWFDDTRDYEVVGEGTIKLYESASKNMSSINESKYDNLRKVKMKDANELINSSEYKLESNGIDGIDTYVRYIKGIPTAQFIEINREEQEAYKSRVEFDIEDIEKISDKLLEKEIVVEKPDVIISRNVKFYPSDKEKEITLFCKYKEETRLVKIISNEWISKDGEVYCLNVRCFDIETGKELLYSDIVKYNN